MTIKLTNAKKQKKRRPYPPKYRAECAKKIRRTRPWEKSTGPKTAEGKQKIRRNAYKHGFRSEDMLEIRALLRRQRQFVRDILARHNSG